MRRLFLVAVVGVAVVVGASRAAGSPATAESRWVIRSLGTLGGSYSLAYAINERGQVAGTSQTAAGKQHVFLWANGRMTDLGRYDGDGLFLNERGQVAWNEPGRGNPDGVHTERRAFVWKDGVTTKLGQFRVVGMNDRGQIVGGILAANGEDHAALWENGRVRDLGTLPGGKSSYGASINGKGQVVGSSDTGGKDEDGNPILHAFLWRDGKMRDLGVLPGFARGCWANLVNERGQVFGSCAYAPGAGRRAHAFLWDDGRMRDLGPFPDSPTLFNERGDVAGYGYGGGFHAFFWADGKMTVLGNLGVKETSAYALNDKGQVVGESRTKTGARHAFVWENGKMTDLGTLPGGRNSRADAINNKSQIVGGSVERGYNARSRAVLWTLRHGT